MRKPIVRQQCHIDGVGHHNSNEYCTLHAECRALQSVEIDVSRAVDEVLVLFAEIVRECSRYEVRHVRVDEFAIDPELGFLASWNGQLVDLGRDGRDPGGDVGRRLALELRREDRGGGVATQS